MAQGTEFTSYKNNGSNVKISTGGTSNTISAFKNAGSDIKGSSYSDSYANYMKRAFDADKFKINGNPIDICKLGYRPRTIGCSVDFIHLGPGTYEMTCDSTGKKVCNGIQMSPSNTDVGFRDAFFIWGVAAGGSGGTGNSTRNGAGGGGGCAFDGVLTFNGLTNTKVLFYVGTGGASETGDGDNYGHDGGVTSITTYNTSGSLIDIVHFIGGSGGGANGGGGGSGGSWSGDSKVLDPSSGGPYVAYLTTAWGAKGGNAGAWGGNVSWTTYTCSPEPGVALSYSGGKPGGSDNNRGGGGGASGFHNGGYGTTYKNDSEAGTYGSGSGGTGYRVAGSIGNSGKGGDGFIEIDY
jgi:hypothetical protein